MICVVECEMRNVRCIHSIKYISSTAEYCCPRPGSESEGAVDIIRDDGGRGWVLGCRSITQWLSRCQNTTWQSLIVTQLLGERTGRVTNISVYFKFDFIINFYASHFITPTSTSTVPYSQQSTYSNDETRPFSNVKVGPIIGPGLVNRKSCHWLG